LIARVESLVIFQGGCLASSAARVAEEIEQLNLFVGLPQKVFVEFTLAI
jgi:hypothetical protein